MRAGHALYEQNLNPKWQYQPVGSTCSFGIHESQSRFYENIIGRSKEFWTSFLPKIKQAAPSLSKLQLDPFVQAINKVERSKIRIEADEVTYSLHIIIRFELERDLFADKITIDELPEAWNQKYADYLGVKVENDSEGVMQDTHWASGLVRLLPKLRVRQHLQWTNNSCNHKRPSRLAHAILQKENSKTSIDG